MFRPCLRFAFPDGTSGHAARVNDLAFGPDGSLFSCSDDKHIFQWNARTAESIKCASIVFPNCLLTCDRSLKKDKEAVQRIAVSPDGSQLASASTSIKVYACFVDMVHFLMLSRSVMGPLLRESGVQVPRPCTARVLPGICKSLF